MMSEDEPLSAANRETSFKSPSESVLGENTVAVLMRQEGRQTVDNLNNGLSDIDTKASKLMRANIVLAGLLLSAFSFASKSNDINASPFINSFSISGIVVLVASIVAAGITYTATESRVGVSPRTINEFLNSDLERVEAERGLAKAYARWVEINRRANVENAFYISITILFAIASVILLSIAVFVGTLADSITRYSRFGVWLVALLLITGVGWIADVQQDYEEWKKHGRTTRSDGEDRNSNNDDDEKSPDEKAN